MSAPQAERRSFSDRRQLADRRIALRRVIPDQRTKYTGMPRGLERRREMDRRIGDRRALERRTTSDRRDRPPG